MLKFKQEIDQILLLLFFESLLFLVTNLCCLKKLLTSCNEELRFNVLYKKLAMSTATKTTMFHKSRLKKMQTCYHFCFVEFRWVQMRFEKFREICRYFSDIHDNMTWNLHPSLFILWFVWNPLKMFNSSPRREFSPPGPNTQVQISEHSKYSRNVVDIVKCLSFNFTSSNRWSALEAPYRNRPCREISCVDINLF